jgi:hypothetical protein
MLKKALFPTLAGLAVGWAAGTGRLDSLKQRIQQRLDAGSSNRSRPPGGDAANPFTHHSSGAESAFDPDPLVAHP